MGAYLIENPQKAADTVAQYVAGVESAVKAYKAILKSKPQAKSRAMDELVAKEAEGQLPDYVRDVSKDCEDTNHA
jgi:trehalose-6-phosphate synthase